MFKKLTISIIAFLFLSPLSFGQIKAISDESLKNASTQTKQEVKTNDLKYNQIEWRQFLYELKENSKNNSSVLNKEKQNNLIVLIDGPGTSGGGNNYESEFYFLAEQLMSEIGIIDFNPQIINSLKDSFSRFKKEKAIVFTKDRLFLDNKEKTAINDYSVFAVIVNQQLWDQSSFIQKRHIILHELLGLSRAFDISINDSDFSLSSAIILKLQKMNQKIFLLNTDYPKNFEKVNLTSSTAHGQELYYHMDEASGTCLKVGNSPSHLSMKLNMKNTEGKATLQISFEIFCHLMNGKTYSHIEGIDGSDVLDIVSKNTLELNIDFGSYLIGWISGDDLLIRSPANMISLKKNLDGTYRFHFEFYRSVDGKKETIDSVLTLLPH